MPGASCELVTKLGTSELGTELRGSTRQGSYTERAAIPADALVPFPDEIDDRTAAAVMMQGLTASHFATDFYPVQPAHITDGTAKARLPRSRSYLNFQIHYYSRWRTPTRWAGVY